MASNQDNESEIRKQLADLPGRNKLCDVMFHVGEDTFVARKDVLMLRMDYFRNMFTADKQEKDQTIVKLDPEFADPAVFNDILDYVYTLNIDFITDKLESLYRAVDFFCFTELKTKFENFMKDNISMDNLSVIFDIAVKFNLKAQEEECKKFIIANPLLDSKARPAVGYLDFTELSSLLQKQSSLSMFEEMFHSSIEWILHDEKDRSKRVSDLLQLIPLGRLSSEFCEQVISTNTLVMNDNKCLQLLFKAVIARPPVEELYVFGGMDRTQLSSMSTYDSSTRQWFCLGPVSSEDRLTHFAYCVADQKIYVCGGFNGKKNMNKLFMYNRNTHQWSILKAMKYRRQGCAMALLDGHLYVAGGVDSDNKELSVVERYSIENDQWETVSSMIHKRSGLELVQMNGLLYAMGGQDITKPLKSAEQFDPQTGKWTAIANMNHSHVHFGSAVFNNRIYVVGKFGCEEYSPEEDKWQAMASPTECQHGRRMTVFDGKLYTIGGSIGETGAWKGIKTVEYYDSEKQTWVTAEDMNIARCYHGVAVVTRTYTPQ